MSSLESRQPLVSYRYVTFPRHEANSCYLAEPPCTTSCKQVLCRMPNVVFRIAIQRKAFLPGFNAFETLDFLR